MKELKKEILVERETYEKNEKTYFSYYIKGVVRGKNIKLSVVPKDVGGYTVLDIVFVGAETATLVEKPYELKDDSGKTISGCTYAVRNVDEDGVVYECNIKPSKDSDKMLLNMLLR